MNIREVKEYLKNCSHECKWELIEKDDEYLILDIENQEIILAMDRNLNHVKFTSWIYSLEELKHLNFILKQILAE